VIDPRPDVKIYIKLARKWNVCMTHVFETHIHADLVSGARELAARTHNAKVYASVEDGAQYDFEVEPVKDGDRFEFGDTLLIARHTPGHTPEHTSYAAADKSHSDSPWGAFTGDSLLVNSAGRPDLLGKDADKLAAQLDDTFFNVFGKMEEGVIIFPAHGHGSPCGAGIGDRLESTIGYEKRFNPYLGRRTRRSSSSWRSPPRRPSRLITSG
jgi:hydroxyacylglutathione hydrolase